MAGIGTQRLRRPYRSFSGRPVASANPGWREMMLPRGPHGTDKYSWPPERALPHTVRHVMCHLWECARWLVHIAEREATRLPPLCKNATSLSEAAPTPSVPCTPPNVGHLASGVSGQTPLLGRKTGRLPKRTRKDGGLG